MIEIVSSMHATRVIVCSWNGARRIDDVVKQPNVSAVESAIRRLDGTLTTEVCIETDGDDFLIIGGGSGRYVGFMGRGEDEMVNLCSSSGSSDRQVELCVGGQTGYYSERQLVDLPTAIQAACKFAENGELDGSVNWEVQG